MRASRHRQRSSGGRPPGWLRGLLRGFRPLDWLATALLLAGLAGVAAHLTAKISPPDEISGFAEIIDGDSLRLAGHEIRLKGLDAPELRQWCENVAGRRIACGVVASRALRAEVTRGATICKGEGMDRYGRLLARCRVGALDLNAWLVEQGHAVAFGDYEAEEDRARLARRGVWAGRFQRPAEWRAENPRRDVPRDAASRQDSPRS